MLGGVADLTQFVLDRAILQIGFDPGGTKHLTDYNPLCFCAGTMIMTPLGYVPVERLSPGDLVLSYRGDYRKIRWIASRKIGASFLAKAQNALPVQISAGALAPGVPDRDLYVSQQHRLLIGSEMTQKLCHEAAVLAAAVHLVGLPGIHIDKSRSNVEYYHILLDQHEVLLANGAWSESLFTGPMALKSLPYAAVEEIRLLFPELFAPGYFPRPALPFLTGKETRRLIRRHAKTRASLCDLPFVPAQIVSREQPRQRLLH